MKYDSIYLTSGGTNGYIYIGALQILEDYNVLKNIKKIIGCSVGSIFGLFYLLNYKSKDILKILTKNNVEEIYINNKINNDNIILNITSNFGINDGNGIIRLLNIFLEHKKISTNITLKELFKLYKKEFYIITSNINENKHEIISYKTYPDMPVTLAIRASCSIPFLFSPIKYQNKLLVDGGFITDIKTNLINDNTLILRLTVNKYYDTNMIVDNIYDYTKIIIQCILLQTQMYNYNNNTIEYKFNYSGINFNLSYNDKIKLYYKGILTTLIFIKNYKIKSKYFKYFKNIVNIKL